MNKTLPEIIASTILEDSEVRSKSYLTDAQRASVVESLNKPSQIRFHRKGDANN